MDKTRLTAETILTALHDISETATQDLRELKPVTVFNISENFNAFENNRKNTQKAGLSLLTGIPAKFRCVLSHGANGEKTTVYVSPGYDFSAFSDARYQVINNVSPVGRLANQADVGEKIGVSDWVLVEKQSFTPQKNGDSWDGKQNIFCDKDNEAYYSSLREIAANTNSSSEDKINGNDSHTDVSPYNEIKDNNSYIDSFDMEKILSSFKKDTIPNQSSKLGTVIFLDNIQSEIEELPLNVQFVLMGPPGTGKTTTLLRRLKYQLYNNREKIDNIEKSWILFTPTKLLREYLYKAINKESIPVPSDNVRTWEDFIEPFARKYFLNTPKEKRKFSIDFSDILFEKEVPDVLGFFDSFFKWQGKEYIKYLVRTYKELFNLSVSGKTKIISFERVQYGVKQNIQEKDIIDVIEEKIPLGTETNDIFSLLKGISLNENDLLSDISIKLNRLFQDSPIKSIYQKWIEIIKNYHAKIVEKLDFYKNKENKTSAEKIKEIRLNQILKKSDEKIESISNIINLIQKLEAPIDEYAETIYKRYSQFLMECDGGPLSSRGNRISVAERDILSLAILKIFKAFSKSTYLFYKNPSLESFSKDISKLQIFVDEMTDFSPIQISGMFQLSDKNVNSFFAGGDFNQRLTKDGCSNKNDLYWAIGNSLQIKEIKKNYRLSLKLIYLSSVILHEVSDVDITSNEYTQSPNPIWLKNASDLNDTAIWIVKNIGEIFNRFNDFPSIAVLVGNEADVIPTATALEAKGNDMDMNLRVEACVHGQSIGTETNVRVFDIHHIKGLEFEAVFFISLDRMFSKNLSDIVRYLYVGATRAANFLGITTAAASLPKNLEQCSSLFKEAF